MLAHAVLSPMLSSTDAGTPPMFGIPGGGVAVSGYPSPLINGAPNGKECPVSTAEMPCDAASAVIG